METSVYLDECEAIAETFCVMTEVFDTKVGRKQLSSKSTVTLLGRLQGF